MATTRRLAAIMFTDMVGSTAAAQANEAEALKLRDEQEALVRPLFAAHQGREIKPMGDGFLVEFDSALRAVQCAIDIQQHLHERNSQPGKAPIQLRVGVHLGDVEQRGTDIFGDAVNIASRIEPVASPGGVCISGEVFSQIRNKIPNKLEKLPPTALKGVQVSIDLYRVVLPWTSRESPSGDSGPTGIAVLPFTNISPDPKDEFFAEGLTEELITVLSQLRGLRVISRTSVMQYKATTKSVTQIGAELGVVSLLEGSVRKAGNRLRVTAQLIDAQSDRHLWAKTYDRELDDIFAVQAELAKQVAKALKIELRATEEARLESKPTVRPDSYLAYLKGRTLMHLPLQASLESAKTQFELAISLDPNNAAAHSGLADTMRLMGWWFVGAPRKTWDETARRLAARAVELDPNMAEGHASLAIILWEENEYQAAEREFKLALSLNPSYSLAHHWYAGLLQDEARTDEALREFALAEGADPLWEFNFFHFASLLIWLRRFDDALVKIRRLGELDPEHGAHHLLLAQYYRARSDTESALKEMGLAGESTTDPQTKQFLRWASYAFSGEKEKLDAAARDEKSLEAPLARYYLALDYAVLGDLDACFHHLNKRLEIAGHFPFQALRLDPMLESIRRDPRFQQFLSKLNLA